MVPFNSFTIHSFVAFAVLAGLMLPLVAVNFALGRRRVELLLALSLLPSMAIALMAFLSDNLVLAGTSSWGRPGGPSGPELAAMNLLVIRVGYSAAVLAMVTQLHFVLAYTGLRNWLARHMWIAYLLAMPVIAVIWTPLLLRVRPEPLAPTSSWTCPVPWAPVTSPAMAAVMAGWIAVNLYSLRLLWRYGQVGGARRGALRHWRLVFLAFAFHAGLGVLVFAVNIAGYTGPALAPVMVMAKGAVLVLAMVCSRVDIYRELQRLHRERTAILESVAEQILCYDRDLRLQWTSAAASEAGLDTALLAGEDVDGIWAQRGLSGESPTKTVLASGRPSQTEAVDAEGRVWFICAYPLRDERDACLGAVELVVEVTQLKRAERVLREKNVELLNAREEERRQIAADLHDSFAQSLVSLQMALRMAADTAEADVPRELLLEMARRCKELIREVRQICHGLYPPALESLGLVPALRKMLSFYEHSGVNATLRTRPANQRLRLPGRMEIALFRICQESVSNALRHGQAGQIDVDLAIDRQ
ncbi:MAG: histidine kinase [Planctomycetota bacterium]